MTSVIKAPKSVEIDGVKYGIFLDTIESTYLGNSERSRGYFSFNLYFNSISLGGFVLANKHLSPEDHTADLMIELFKVLGVDCWEDVKGQRAWVLTTMPGGAGSLGKGLMSVDMKRAMVFSTFFGSRPDDDLKSNHVS